MSRIGEATATRYSAVAIILHWLIAAIILLQLVLGWRMADATAEARTAIFQLHKAIGLTILLLSLARLAWRLANPPPPEPESLLAWERLASSWAHRGLYGVMIGLPLSGWIMISATRAGASTKLLGPIPWPRLPFLSALPPAAREAVSSLADSAHVALVWIALALLALHIAGALKHQFLSRDPVMARMVPGLRPGRLVDTRLAAIAITAVVTAALAYAPKAPPPAAPRPQVTELARADVYLDVVQPTLNRRCASCHNDDRSRGGFSVASYDALLEGGAHGPAVVAHQPTRSELFKRINLPSTHKDYMPAAGRKPLSAEQVQAIGWWISLGAPASGSVGMMKIDDRVRPALMRALRLDGGGEEGGEGVGERLPTVGKADPAQIEAAEAAGFIVRPVSEGSNLLDINYYKRKPVTDADIALLKTLQPQARTLILRGAGVTDAQLAVIGGMPNLTGLRLEENPITDAGVARLAGLTKLRSLNLHGTQVSDRALSTLAALPSLERLYLWETKATRAGIDRVGGKLKIALESQSAGPVGQPAAPVTP